MRTTTPTATCTKGHTHVSAYAAATCGQAPLPTTYGPLTQTERSAVTRMPCSA